MTLNLPMKLEKYQHGVTLIELMLALVISSVLLLGVGAIYSNSKRTYLVQEEFAHLQESARFAMKLLVEDIRMAGFIGCAWNNDLNYENFLNTTDPFIGNFRVGLEGYEANGTGAGTALDLTAPTAGWHAPPPAVVAGNIAGSDILIVRHAVDKGIQLASNKDSANFTVHNRGQTTTTVGGNVCHTLSDICEGDILLATDCDKSRLFQATNLQDNPGVVRIVHAASGTPGNSPSSWGGASDRNHHFSETDTEIFQASAFAYFVAISATTNEPSLFRISARAGSVAEELIQGVENMQVLYGIDIEKVNPDDRGDGIANRYVPANLVNFANDNVVSARISLLMRTSRDVPRQSAATANTYTMAGNNAVSAVTVTTPADNRLRKVFTTTIKVRNKGLQ